MCGLGFDGIEIAGFLSVQKLRTVLGKDLLMRQREALAYY